MTAIWVLIAFSVVLAASAGIAYCWANGSGQFDDLESPADRIAFEDLENEIRPKEDRLCRSQNL